MHSFEHLACVLCVACCASCVAFHVLCVCVLCSVLCVMCVCVCLSVGGWVSGWCVCVCGVEAWEHGSVRAFGRAHGCACGCGCVCVFVQSLFFVNARQGYGRVGRVEKASGSFRISHVSHPFYFPPPFIICPFFLLSVSCSPRSSCWSPFLSYYGVGRAAGMHNSKPLCLRNIIMFSYNNLC